MSLLQYPHTVFHSSILMLNLWKSVIRLWSRMYCKNIPCFLTQKLSGDFLQPFTHIAHSKYLVEPFVKYCLCCFPWPQVHSKPSATFSILFQDFSNCTDYLTPFFLKELTLLLIGVIYIHFKILGLVKQSYF